MPRAKKIKKEVEKPGVVTEVIAIEEVVTEVMLERRESLWRRLSRWCLLAGAALLPLFFIPETAAIAFISQETVIALAVLFSALFLLIDILKTRSFAWSGPLSYVHYLLFAFLVSTTVSLFLSPSFVLSMWGNGDPQGLTGLILLISFLGFFLASFLFRTEEDISLIGKTISWSFLASLLLVFGANFSILFLKQPFLGVESGGFNLLGSLSSLSVFAGLAFIIPIASLVLFELKATSRAGLILLGVLGLSCLLLVGSDFSYIVTVLALLILLGMWFAHGREGDERRMFGLNTILFFIFALSILTISGYKLGTFLNLPPEITPNFRTSISITSQVLRQGAVPLLFGTGPNTYFADYVRLRPAAVNTTAYWNTDFPAAYSWWLTLLPSLGLIASLSLLLALIGMLMMSFRKVLVGEPGGLLYRAESYLLIITSYLLLSSFIYGITLPILFYLFLSFGLLFGISRLAEGVDAVFYFKTASQTFISSLLATGLIILVLIVGFFTFERAFSLFRANQTINALSRGGDQEKGLAMMMRAYEIFPHENTARVLSSMWFANFIQSTSQTQADMQKAQTDLSSSLGYAQEAARLNPINHQNWALLGDIYRNVLQAEGAAAQALSSFEKARSLNPTNPLYPLFSGQLRLLMSQEASSTEQVTLLTQAEADFKQSIQLKGDLPESHLILGRLYLAEGKKEEAKQEFQAVLSLDPQNQEAATQLKALEGKKEKSN